MEKSAYTREDFTHPNEVRWCPGCGDYAILAALQRVLPELGLAPEKHVFVSGIGCAGRLPYYMNTYGFHTIHGRATAVATGLKLMREDLCVWVITGDGDALSIGTNHLIQSFRRNVNLKILLFNNQVYGLTKGQFSPTSQKGQITKTSPDGVMNHPVNPLMLALGAGATFVARAVDKDPVHLGHMIKAAHAHQGCAFIEIYQDCNIFNHGAFDGFALKTNRKDHTLLLQHKQPMLFGENNTQGLALMDDALTKTTLTESACIHDTSHLNSALRLAQLSYPDFPVPLGIYYQVERACFETPITHRKSTDDLNALYRKKAFWQCQ
jgi:2-oxoglutarate/2-oxoacid ferredoxin oxidoreductase subunit beta